MLNIWFEVKISYLKLSDNGEEKKITELILVDAVSWSDAERRTTEIMKPYLREGGELIINNISKSKIVSIHPFESGETWYKAKTSFIAIDEKSEKEKEIQEIELVNADSLEEALLRLINEHSGEVVPTTFKGIIETAIVEKYILIKKRKKTF